jgi:hypothetical protein
MMLSSSAVDRVRGYRLETTAKLIALEVASPFVVYEPVEVVSAVAVEREP